jgi:2-keto-4-pentenoate hydratase/2-oxohepta-3-ene-1,7-dioic acid hydratase in catechol pathway
MVHGGNQLPVSPLYFTKLPGCLNRHLGDIAAPKGYGDKVLFEAELGVVISCGTSVGVCFMKPGQQIEIRIPGLGSLVNRYSG